MKFSKWERRVKLNRINVNLGEGGSKVSHDPRIQNQTLVLRLICYWGVNMIWSTHLTLLLFVP